MIYCISDIHGHYKEFMALLQKINFNSDDTLYILGDVIDRGEDSIKCLQFIMSKSNVHMLMGNHEALMIDACCTGDNRLWYHNGGESTYNQFKELTESEQKDILQFLQSLPIYQTIKVRSKQYLLVHAGLDCRRRKPRERLLTTIKRQRTKPYHNMLWVREEFYFRKALPSYMIVFGHTPTRKLHITDTIWHGSRYRDKIGIDCGCYRGGHLAALRLDDAKEFYVPKHKKSE